MCLFLQWQIIISVVKKVKKRSKSTLEPNSSTKAACAFQMLCLEFSKCCMPLANFAFVQQACTVVCSSFTNVMLTVQCNELFCCIVLIFSDCINCIKDTLKL